MKLDADEWQVMQALWRNSPASAPEVEAVLRRRGAHAPSRVEGVLDRLAQRGAVAVRRDGTTNRYAPLAARDETRGAAVRRLVDDAFDGSAAALLEFLLEADDLPAHERAEMARLLGDRGQEDAR